MSHNQSVGLTHAEFQLLTIIQRQGMVGASLSWLASILDIRKSAVVLRIQRLNDKLDGCTVKSDGVVYRVATKSEAAFISEVNRGCGEDKFYEPVFA